MTQRHPTKTPEWFGSQDCCSASRNSAMQIHPVGDYLTLWQDWTLRKRGIGMRAVVMTVLIFAEYRHHAPTSAGYRSGLSACRGTPVSRSMGNTNSPGTPRLERDSQYQTCDCVVPMRSARGFWPPARSHASFSAAVDDMGPSNPNLGESQPKNLWRTAHLNLGSVLTMREIDSAAFGARVRARREELGMSQGTLGKEAGYSQQNINTIEHGGLKRPERCAAALARALNTSTEWLLWAKGFRAVGPKYLTSAELVEKYETLSPEQKKIISQAIENTEARRRKLG